MTQKNQLQPDSCESSSPAASILAGGRSIRLGGLQKSFIPVQGVPLIKRTVDLLKKIFTEIILITNNQQAFEDYAGGLILTGDILTGIGPLGGIHASLSRASREAVFFVACDMPFLDEGLILREIECFTSTGCEALVPRINTGTETLIEPLHAIYKKSLKTPLERFLRTTESFAIRSFLNTIDVRYLDLEDIPLNRNIFINLNTRKDFKMAAQEGGREQFFKGE